MARRQPGIDRESKSSPIGAARPRSARRRLRVIVVVTVAVAVLATVGLFQARESARAARLPALPDLSGHTAAIRAHLGDADRAARSDPSSPDVVRQLCLAYHADLFYPEATVCYTALAALDPAEWKWPYHRALAQIGRGLDPEASADLRDVVRRAPEFGPALARLGDAEFKEGRVDVATDLWTRARSAKEPAILTPDDTPLPVAPATVSDYANVGLARVALIRGDAATARDLLEPVVKRAPRFATAWRVLAGSYAELGRHADGRRAAARADSLPASGSFVDPVTIALAKESRSSLFLLQQAVEADLATSATWQEYLIRRALSFHPDSPEVVYEASAALRRQGRHEEALVYLRQYQRMLGDDPLVSAELGSYLGQLGRFEEAESLLRRAALGPPNANVHYDLGAVLAQQGRTPDAFAEFAQAIELNPFHVSARLNLAGLLMLQRRNAEASTHLQRVLTIDPANAKAHANMGVLLEESGQSGRAVAHFEEALRLDPELGIAAERLKAIRGSRR